MAQFIPLMTNAEAVERLDAFLDLIAGGVLSSGYGGEVERGDKEVLIAEALIVPSDMLNPIMEGLIAQGQIIRKAQGVYSLRGDEQLIRLITMAGEKAA